MRERIVLKGVVLSLLAGLLIFGSAWGISFARVMLEPTAPFTAVAWDRWTPHVQIKGTWYELVAINDDSVTEIMAFSRRWFPGKPRKRFSQDLGQVLFSMGKFPGAGLDLTVCSLDGTRTETLVDVPMTRENRAQTWKWTSQRNPFSQVEWTTKRIFVHLDERVYQLDSFHGIAADQLLRWHQQGGRREDSIRALIQERGHPVYLDDIEVHLTDLETQASLVKSLPVRAESFFDRPHLAPFTAVQWDDWAPSVRLDSRWYELVSLNDIPAGEIVTFCQREYEGNAKKRFGEDLERVLIEMGAPAEDSVTLVLKDLESQEISTKIQVAMTRANRQQVWRYNNR